MHNKKIIMIISLCVSLFLITAGYAVYSSNLKIEGTGSIDSNFNIEVTGITEESKKGKAVSVTEPTYTNSTATFNTKLQRAGDNIEYLVEITNNGTIDGKINSIIVTNPSSIVKVETRGIIEGEIIKSGEVKTYIVRVYIEEDTKIEEDITSVIEVNSEIIQDDNQIFNAEVDGIVENKLEIESTKEESDYTSITASINAKGNGLKYYYSLDGETWSEESSSNTYTFTDLEVNTRYTVYYKVEDENLNYVLDSKWINTKDIDSPVIKVSNENNWSTSKEVTIEYPEIEGVSYYYKVEEISEISLLSEEWISTTEKKITINLNNNSAVYAKIEIDGKVLETTKEITKIDNSEPVLTLSTSKTTKSITVVANTTDNSGIDKYEYSIDGGTTWIDNDKYNNYTFKNLVHNTEHTIKVRVTDKVGLTSVSEITETTNLIETPTFSEVGDLNKTVTITYPEGCLSEFICSYVKDSEEDVIVTDSTVEVKFTDEGTLIAKVNDEFNYITSSTYTVTKPAVSEIEGLFIYDVNLVETVDAETKVNDYQKTTLNTDVVLSEENLDSYVSYEVTIYNNTENNYLFKDIVFSEEMDEQYNDVDILYTFDKQNEVISKSGGSLNVTVTFKYGESADTSLNMINSILDFEFVKVYNVSYVGIEDSTLPTMIAHDENLIVDLSSYNLIVHDVSIGGISIDDYVYENKVLTINNIDNDVVISAVDVSDVTMTVKSDLVVTDIGNSNYSKKVLDNVVFTDSNNNSLDLKANYSINGTVNYNSYSSYAVNYSYNYDTLNLTGNTELVFTTPASIDFDTCGYNLRNSTEVSCLLGIGKYTSTVDPSIVIPFEDKYEYFDPKEYRYAVIRYKITGITTDYMSIYATATPKDEEFVVNTKVTGDGQWHEATIDLWQKEVVKNLSYISGIRFDYVTLSGATAEIDYVKFVKDLDIDYIYYEDFNSDFTYKYENFDYSLANSKLNMTIHNIDPMIWMEFTSDQYYDPKRYKFIYVKYSVLTSEELDLKFYMVPKPTDETYAVGKRLITDGNENIIVIDSSSNSNVYNLSEITGWRFDPTNLGDIDISIDYIGVSDRYKT